MRDGLAWRWIGGHAASFALALLAQRGVDYLSGFSNELSMIWVSISTWTLALAVGLTLCVVLVARRQGFPVSAARWGVATLIGLILGMAASMGIWDVLRKVYTQGVWVKGAITAFGWMVQLSAGLLLGLAQALALRGRTSRHLIVLWFSSVVGGWLLMYALVLAQHSVLRGVESKLLGLGLSLLGVAVEGAAFGAVTLPVLRKIARGAEA